MLFKKSKFLIYIFLTLIIFNFIIPICSYAIAEDSIYVWSNNSSSISTSTIPNKQVETTPQDNSRKFFRYYFRWSYINGPKMRNYFV